MTETKFNINTNEYLPLRDVVFNTLRDAILTGKLVPGERLMENQLAEKESEFQKQKASAEEQISTGEKELANDERICRLQEVFAFCLIGF